MRGLGGEIFARLPGRRGSPGGGNGGQKRRDFGPGKPRIDPKKPVSDPNWPGIGPCLTREGVGRDFLCGVEGKIFGLLNFCCMRQVVLFLRGGFI